HGIVHGGVGGRGVGRGGQRQGARRSCGCGVGLRGRGGGRHDGGGHRGRQVLGEDRIGQGGRQRSGRRLVVGAGAARHRDVVGQQRDEVLGLGGRAGVAGDRGAARRGIERRHHRVEAARCRRGRRRGGGCGSGDG